MLLCIVSIVVGAQKSNVVEAISEFAIIIESLPLGNVQILFMYTPCAIEGGNVQFLHNYNKHVLLLLWSSHHVWEMWKEGQSILTYVKQECVHEADAISRGDNIFRFFHIRYCWLAIVVFLLMDWPSDKQIVVMQQFRAEYGRK